MSKLYTEQVADALSKKESRFKVARSIKATGDHNKIIHYLGGVSPETQFENYFPMENHTFVRYEKEECETPKHYCDAWLYSLAPEDSGYTFQMRLNDKKDDEFGYFVNNDFFAEVEKFMQIFEDEKNYFWLDFCGMPTEKLLKNLHNFISNQNKDIEEVYTTFYINPRAVEYVSNVLGRYGSTLEDKAKSLCDTLKENFSIDGYTYSVFDVYLNGNSPMAVIKLKRKPMKNKTTKTKTSFKIDSESYAVMRDAGLKNSEIQLLTRKPRQAIAAFQAWNTMGGKTWDMTDANLIAKRSETIHMISNMIKDVTI